MTFTSSEASENPHDLCASLTLSVKCDNNGTYHTESFCKVLYVKHSELCLSHNKHYVLGVQIYLFLLNICYILAIVLDKWV